MNQYLSAEGNTCLAWPGASDDHSLSLVSIPLTQMKDRSLETPRAGVASLASSRRGNSSLCNEELIEAANKTKLLPFTGERVIPGATETQVWNEHVARYRFASLFASGKAALDVGSGAGYGAQILAGTADSVVGFDVSQEAVQFAASAYKAPEYLCANADCFPFKSSAFGIVTAFEVIEHLHKWPALVEEAARVLTPEGIFVVSTPKTDHYTESRGPSRANPFHVHEFEFEDFGAALRRVFPHVQIVAQNQVEAIAFTGASTRSVTSAFVPSHANAAGGHFFVAVCSFHPVSIPVFVDVSNTHNLLRERERHIRGLMSELSAAQCDYAALDVHYQLSLQAQAELAAQVAVLSNEQQVIRASAWIRLGLLLGVGPWSNYRARIRNLWLRARHSAAKAKAFLELTVARCAVVAQRYIVAPCELGAVAASLAGTDICFALVGRKKTAIDTAATATAASIIIPSWDGWSKLAANLPSVLAAAALVPGCEIMVVDDGSTDATAEKVGKRFPTVRVIRSELNEGFASACNKGARQAANEIVIFLNNDMRVEAEFVSMLVRHFNDAKVFAASCQIFFSDSLRTREETGLTEAAWEDGHLRVGHRVDPQINQPFPCAYPGGSSSAFHRSKFLELGGFDEVFRPFYYEDTDLGFRAWKRGWKVLYEPESIVHHDHRGTIARKFSSSAIDCVARSNAQLYCWKNLHDWRLLISHFWRSLSQILFTDACEHADPQRLAPDDVHRNASRLRQVLRCRWHSKQSSRLSDVEAFRRPLGGYFHDRFMVPERPSPRLQVLFVSPYPIEPPTHGGAVFMRETIRALSRLADVHVVSLVDCQDQLAAQENLLTTCSSGCFLVRPRVSLVDQRTMVPNAIREFGIQDLKWAIHRLILMKQIDVVQLEYTTMGQYGEKFRNIPCILFEHDISTQSLWRRIKTGDRDPDTVIEFARMWLYERKLLRRISRVQVCSAANAKCLKRFTPWIGKRVDADIRAAIDVREYQFSTDHRQPDSLLFIGSFRHAPNITALHWFIDTVLPAVLAQRPQTKLYVVGSGAPTEESWHPSVKIVGAVDDVRVPLQRYSAFICPVKSGSGIRVKLLEAFASGIPAVSTSVGAEGLVSSAKPVCEVADTALDFAAATIKLLTDREHCLSLARNARSLVEESRDSRRSVVRLETTYRQQVAQMRGLSPIHSPDRIPIENLHGHGRLRIFRNRS